MWSRQHPTPVTGKGSGHGHPGCQEGLLGRRELTGVGPLVPGMEPWVRTILETEVSDSRDGGAPVRETVGFARGGRGRQDVYRNV